jgi:hypothetical protein
MKTSSDTLHKLVNVVDRPVCFGGIANCRCSDCPTVISLDLLTIHSVHNNGNNLMFLRLEHVERLQRQQLVL